MLDLTVVGSATVLPAVLDFDRDREASPARMNRAMEYLYLRLAAATALQPEFESAIAELQAVGLDRLNEVLGPIFAESTAIAAQLTTIKAAWITGQPLEQLLADLDARVTAKLVVVDAQLAANLAAVTAKLTAVDDKLAAFSPTAKWPEASATEARAGAASRLISAAILWAMQAPVALNDTATIAVDLSAGQNFTVTVNGNRVLGNPTGGRAGQQGSIFVTQGVAGGWVLSYGANYVPDDLATYPLLNAGAGTVTELRYKVAADGKVRLYGGKPSGPAFPAFGYRSGVQYGPPYPGGAQQIVFGGTMFVPVEIRAAVTIAAVCARIVQNVSVIGSIYSNDKGRPGVRLVQSASIAVNTGAQLKCPLSITLQPGFYWLALSYNGSAQTYGTTSNMAVTGYFERPETTDGTYYDSIKSSDTAPPATFAEASSPSLQNYSPIITFQVA